MKTKSAFDSIVMITVLTSDPTRRDQIDLLIDAAFAKDPRIQTIRVVGYSDPATTVELARDIEAFDAAQKDAKHEES